MITNQGKQQRSKSHLLQDRHADHTTQLRLAEEEHVEQRMRHQWDHIGHPVGSREIGERMWLQISRNTLNKKRILLSRLLWRGAAVAAVLLVFFCGRWWLKNQQQVVAPTVAVVDHSYYAIDSHTFILPDSSVVWMKKGATLRYKSDFLSHRVVSMSGQAVFDVRKMNNQPFKVYAGETMVDVKGTVFQVVSHDDTGEHEVTLYKGAVDFTTSAHGQRIQMKPGQRVSYNATTDDLELHRVALIEWVNGRFHFTDTSLEKLASSLSDLYHVEVKLASNLPRRFHFNGYIRYDETLEQVLDKICYNASLRYKQQNNQYVIYK